ncbi:MAG: hypothetical protein HY038_11770, partial [Nitrospirae bacterium]|nr:hypothetical protein [Nitrospirota bacterium]
MSRQHDERLEIGEARREVVDDVDDSHSEGASEPAEKESGRPEGLDTLKSYLREVRRSTLLTFKQEQQLGKRVMAGDEQARQQMIESNLRLVIS